MQAEDDKKKIAAIAAVLTYLQQEEEAPRYALPAGKLLVPPPEEGFWSYSGRQSQMLLRSMAQMRLFPAWKG